MSSCERLESLFRASSHQFPQYTAVVESNRRLSYSELSTEIEAFKLVLTKAGIAKGDRVILWLENSVEYIVAYLSTLELGGVVVGLHSQTMPDELSRIIRHVGATALIHSELISEAHLRLFQESGLNSLIVGSSIQPLSDTNPHEKAPADLAQIIYTSGSTGEPKGVMLSHQNLITNTRSILEYLPIDEKSSIVAALPFVYSYGNSILLTHLVAGAKLVIEKRSAFASALLEQMKKEAVTGFSGVASTYAMLMSSTHLKTKDFPALKYITNAGGPMPQELLKKIQRTWPGRSIFLMYGQTEASARLTYLPPDELEKRSTSAGHAIPGVSLKIRKEDGTWATPGETGEVVVSGENIMMGYWKNEMATTNVIKNGWLHTGDVGYLDEEGYLFIIGRNNEMIKSGGYRISPYEIEEILMRHPEVREVAVVGLEHELLGEIVTAGVVTIPESKATPQSLLAHCAEALPLYKRPKRVYLLSSLPRTTSGKIRRRLLREILMSDSIQARN
jgi:long-chain acyl-CoA synthetase